MLAWIHLIHSNFRYKSIDINMLRIHLIRLNLDTTRSILTAISGHFTLLELSKKGLLPMGISIFFPKIPPILKVEVGFFSTYKSFWNFLPKYRESPLYKLIMTEVSRNLRKIFFRKIPPILKLEVGFFSDRKSFSQIFENTANFFHLKFIS